MKTEQALIHRTFYLTLFGPAALSQHGSGARVHASPQQLLLLCLLALAGREGICRRRLQSLLWAERGEKPTGNRLSQLLLSLRKQLGGMPILFEEAGRLFLNPSRVRSDLDTLEAFLQHGTPLNLARAVALVTRGELAELVGGSARIGALRARELWLDDRREEIRGRLLATLGQVRADAMRRGDPRTVLELSELWVRFDPSSESAWVQCLRATATVHGPARARRRSQEMETLFRREDAEWEAGEELEDTLAQLHSADGREWTPPDPPLENSAPPLVGRQAVLEKLVRALQAPATGGSRTVWVYGQRGDGRTRICRAALNTLGPLGRPIYSGECTPALRGVPYGPLLQAFALQLPSHLWLQSRAEILLSMLGILRVPPGEATPLLFLDDAHDMDDETKRMLQLLARCEPQVPFTLLLTSHPLKVGVAPVISALRGRHPTTTLHLKPLTDEESDRLLDHLLGEGGEPPDRLWLKASAKGCPALLCRFAGRTDARNGVRESGDPLPEARTLRVLEDGPPHTLEVVALIAGSRKEWSEGSLSTLLEVGSATLMGALDYLEANGIVTRGPKGVRLERFLYGEVVLGLRRGSLRELFVRKAQLLEATGAPPSERAQAWYLAGRPEEAVAAARLLAEDTLQSWNRWPTPAVPGLADPTARERLPGLLVGTELEVEPHSLYLMRGALAVTSAQAGKTAAAAESLRAVLWELTGHSASSRTLAVSLQLLLLDLLQELPGKPPELSRERLCNLTDESFALGEHGVALRVLRHALVWSVRGKDLRLQRRIRRQLRRCRVLKLAPPDALILKFLEAETRVASASGGGTEGAFEVLRMSLALGDPDWIIESRILIVKAALREGQLRDPRVEGARRWLEEWLSSGRGSVQPEGVPNPLSPSSLLSLRVAAARTLARWKATHDDFEDGQILLDTVLSESRAAKHPQRIFQCQLELGLLLVRMGRFVDCGPHLREAEALAEAWATEEDRILLATALGWSALERGQMGVAREKLALMAPEVVLRMEDPTLSVLFRTRVMRRVVGASRAGEDLGDTILRLRRVHSLAFVRLVAERPFLLSANGTNPHWQRESTEAHRRAQGLGLLALSKRIERGHGAVGAGKS